MRIGTAWIAAALAMGMISTCLATVTSKATVRKVDRTDPQWSGRVGDTQSSNKTDVIFYIWLGGVDECEGQPDEIWRYKLGCTNTGNGQSAFRNCSATGVLTTDVYTQPNCQGWPSPNGPPWHLDVCNAWQWAQELVQCPHIL
mmetsp:Transcript_50825/g.156866  ORF Transcript_50825/g.156866 Transcript_50825/m.156866 type:complete len:143 (+) Transcript_50825:634-1062(+)